MSERKKKVTLSRKFSFAKDTIHASRFADPTEFEKRGESTAVCILPFKKKSMLR